MIFTPDGTPLVAFGSPGGATIINSVLNVTLNLIDHGMTLQEAIDAPRVSVTATGSGVSRRAGLPGGDDQTDCGRWATRSSTAEIGSVQAVIVDRQTGKQYGGADTAPRRHGDRTAAPAGPRQVAGRPAAGARLRPDGFAGSGSRAIG